MEGSWIKYEDGMRQDAGTMLEIGGWRRTAWIQMSMNKSMAVGELKRHRGHRGRIVNINNPECHVLI